ncbi:MAG: SAM-dependent methyltransferase [Paludibacteraceae bacterium]|jgi:16S rRNA G966 N2-methylase RsmD|nr:SAM-dependent methyltransferase [Paludibacteraceae bacterium]HOH95645.1 SAM-dependent methyltransferase [Candidatus Enterocola sp.]HPG55108.1 SAM-dependent methyltransferase [Candidatus Enterocola sp.]
MTKDSSENRIYEAEQLEGKAIANIKIPSWAAIDNIKYPKRLSMEQCSSEYTAKYKANLVQGDSFTDLTGGFGVDFAFMSQSFKKATYNEQNTDLFNIANHNFKLLQLNNVQTINYDAIEYLNSIKKQNCIYIDPARRSKSGRKMIRLEDCEPDLTQIKDKLLSKCDTLIVKLSPMLDMDAALKNLPETSDIHVISIKNECKELIFVLQTNNEHASTQIHCVNILEKPCFTFTKDEEKNAQSFFSMPLKYLYEPNSSILKAGAFKMVGIKYNAYKLHINSHLYTSKELIDSFPGRCFEIMEICSAHKNKLKHIQKANLAIRNFPSSVDELQKKIGIKDGGELYLFATTILDGSKNILVCKKVNKNDISEAL